MADYASPIALIMDIATFKHAKSPFSGVLVLVPIIISLFFVGGPESKKRSNSAKNE